MSTTRSCSTSALASGSTKIGPGPRLSSRVTQASTSRPLTRMPQVPQDAWQHEYRRVSDRSR